MKTTRSAGTLFSLLGLLGGCGATTGARPAAASAATPAGWLAPPAAPPALAVPAGAKLELHAHGAGAQVYACTAGAPGAAPAWVLQAPDARLLDAAGAEIGTHGAGPTWTAADGSAVVAKKVADAPAPAAGAIAWLLLRATANRGAGTFAGVGYVQRLATAGGKAPATGCDAAALGKTLRVDYTAEYYFYAGATPAGG